MSLAPNISPITAAPLPGGINPFDSLQPEMVEEILDRIDNQESRLDAEYACPRFSSFAAPLTAEGTLWMKAEEFTYNSTLSLYQTFKKRMRQLHVEFLSVAFMHNIIRFDHFLVSELNALDYFRTGTLRTLQPILKRFVIDEAIESSAEQDIDKMTIGSFKERRDFISLHNFPETPVTLETRMRKAIKRHGTDQFVQRTAEIESVRREFANPASNAPRFLGAQRSIIASLEQEKKELETKRFQLCGPNGFDGAIDAAYREKQQAKAKLVEALHAVNGLISRHIDAVAVGVNAELVLFHASHFSENLSSMVSAELFAAHAAYSLKTTRHSILSSALATIAQYDQTGQIIRGRLFEIAAALQPDTVASRARDEVTLLADFFGELNQDVDETNEVARSHTLHAILDRVQ